MELLTRRIEHLRANIRMTSVMKHFGHRYRTHGNMLCPFHQESNPSARLYEDQDTFWCWVCSPSKGVDIIEYVLLELALDEEADPQKKLGVKERRALATFMAIEYLEREFRVAYLSEPWESRLHESLRRKTPKETPERYWRISHVQVLRMLASREAKRETWRTYARLMHDLLTRKSSPISEQMALWSELRKAMAQPQ